MQYRGRKAYQREEVARAYDAARFTSLKGRLVDWLEKGLFDRALKSINVGPPARILDLACGTGRLSIHLAGQGFQINSLDLSREMINALKAKTENEDLAGLISAHVGDAESLPYRDGVFDAVVSLRLLGHTPPPARLRILKELRRVTKRYCLLAYYHKHCLQGLARRRKRSGQGEWHPVSLRDIEEELTSADLRKVKSSPLLFGVSETVLVLAEKVSDK